MRSADYIIRSFIFLM